MLLALRENQSSLEVKINKKISFQKLNSFLLLDSMCYA